MVRTGGATQVHETNFSHEIPDGISSLTMVLYRSGCQERFEVVSSLCAIMRLATDGCVPLAGAGRDTPEWPKEVSRL
jgi:hypothetical protein